MEEKVTQFKSPDNNNLYQAIKADRSGKASAEGKNNLDKQIVIPKPNRLSGGTDVYQKEGLPYWFCKIKNTRDEFMVVYMADLEPTDLYFDAQTGEERVFETEMEKELRNNVLKALKNKPKKGYRWLSTREPSSDGASSIAFVDGKRPWMGLTCNRWEGLTKNYSTRNKSKCMTKTTYYLLLLRWLKDGFVTVDQLTKHSEQIGHYTNSINPRRDIEKTGNRMFGGLYGMIGNTYKLVKDSDSSSGYSVVGGHYKSVGSSSPAVRIQEVDYSDSKLNLAVAIVELS